VVADLDQHGDAFGITRLGDRGVVGLGAEFPAIAVGYYRDRDAVGTIDVGLQLGSRHRNEFGFGFGGLAHRDGVLRQVVYLQVAALTRICRGVTERRAVALDDRPGIRIAAAHGTAARGVIAPRLPASFRR
jgi:hypothetical protein